MSGSVARVILPGLVMASLLAIPTAAVAVPTTWQVRAGAQGGDGTVARPFGSLAEVEQASSPGDRIVVQASTTPLDGASRCNLARPSPGMALLCPGTVVHRR